jgi:hypothetical protein
MRRAVASAFARCPGRESTRVRGAPAKCERSTVDGLSSVTESRRPLLLLGRRERFASVAVSRQIFWPRRRRPPRNRETQQFEPFLFLLASDSL